jgi:integrase
MHRTRNAAYVQAYRGFESLPLRQRCAKPRNFLKFCIFNGFVPPDWYTRVVHMPLAMTRPWKHPATGIYWLRRRIPDDLRTLVGKREEKRSLGTRDPDEAKRLHAAALAALETQWFNLRRGTVTLTRSEAEEIATVACREHAEDLIDNDEERGHWRDVGLSLWNSPAQPKLLTVAPKVPEPPDIHADTRMRLKNWCIALAERALADRGMQSNDAAKLRIARCIARAMHHASVAFEAGPYPALTNASPGTLPAIEGRAAPLKQSGPTSEVQFQQLLDGWASEKRPAAKTLYGWQRVLGQLSAFVGHSDAARLTPDDLFRWKAALVADDLRPKTIRDGKLAPVKAILQWGVNNRRLGHNASERLAIDAKVRPSERKRSFNDEEARTVLKASRSEHDALRRWVPWICAYTGARVSEVCQLRAEDVLEHDGIWCIHFAPEAGSLKNLGSERTVPVHSALVDSGFLKFTKRASSGPLFADVKPDRFGSRGGNGTKVLSRWVRSLGIDDPRISPNHSWRHRLRTLGRKHGLAPDILDAITGHSRRTVGDAYGEFPIDAMLREMLKIPELKLA